MTTTSSLIPEQAERESAAAFVERQVREHEEYVACSPAAANPEYERVLEIASRAVAPDAGADEVETVAKAIYLHMFPERDASDWLAEAERDCGRLRDAYLSCARAALSARPRHDFRAGMMRAAEIAEAVPHGFWQKKVYRTSSPGDAAEAIRAEAEASTPEQGADDGWQYTAAVGDAGSAYLRQLVTASDGRMLLSDPNNGLPATFRWHELFDVLIAAASART